MACGGARQLGDGLEAVAPVEGRSVEAGGVERDLRAAASPRLALDGVEKPASEAVPPVGFANPQVLDPARATPRPAVDAGHEGPGLVPHRCEDLASVVDAGRR